MLRPWTTSVYAPLSALSLLLACSSADPTGESTDSASTIGTSTTDNQSSVSDPTTLPTGTTADTDAPTTDGVTTGTTGKPTTDSSSTSTDDTTGTSTTTGTDTGTGTDTDTSIGDTEGSSSTGDPDPSCTDELQNQDETDVDCGGSCAACADGLTCSIDADCVSNDCAEGICAAAACDDGLQNGGETDIDCGGASCPACADAAACVIDLDCQSNICNANICVAPSCDDGIKNAAETDVDCGGPDCGTCADGEVCEGDPDCNSGVCTLNTCIAPTCFDGTKNGQETGIDCGGPACAPCQLPNLVINEIDYDQIGDDVAEFIEIFNNTGAPVNLANLEVRLVNGANNAVYTTIKLAPGGMLAQGQYLVIAPVGFALPPNTVFVPFAGLKDQIQNGAPDGLALVDVANVLVLDAFSYEGAMTNAILGAPFVGTTSLVEGEVLPANIANTNVAPASSLARIPNGNDKNNAATDWALTTNITPGAANQP